MSPSNDDDAAPTRAHLYILGGLLAFLAVPWGVFLAVDVFDVAGSRAVLAAGLPVFVAVAGVPTYAIVRYWRELRADRRSSSLLLAGLGCYAFAGFSSVVLNVVWDFYNRAGEFVTQTLLGGERLARVPAGPWGGPEATGALFMDTVYEETLEPLAAGLILAATAAAASAAGRRWSSPGAKAEPSS